MDSRADRVSTTLLAPDPSFVYRPAWVLEPFALSAARMYPLDEVARDLDLAPSSDSEISHEPNWSPPAKIAAKYLAPYLESMGGHGGGQRRRRAPQHRVGKGRVHRQARRRGAMAGSDEREGAKPTEQRGGAALGEDEAREKGPWAARARDGVVPSELGGSDAPAELQPEDPELGSEVLGGPARSQEPATEAGVDPHGGDNADATSDGGPSVPEGAEPDLKDAASGPRQVDVESAQ